MFEKVLSLAIWVPILMGGLVLLTGKDAQAAWARWIALIGAVLGFLVTIPLYTNFDAYHAGMQFVEFCPWIAAWNVNYHLGVDGISMLFVILNSFTTLMVVLAGWVVIKERVAQYMAAFLIMSGLINGAFAAMDAILFYIFFEAMLIPMYLIIGVWGGANRVYAAIKFFLYTFLGSLLTLVAFIYLYYQAEGSFLISDFQKLALPMSVQGFLLIAFFFAFAVKVPMFPVHTWLPDAHVEAPTGGSMVLAAITLKLGAYGFLRFALPIVPDASREYAWIFVLLSLIAIVYIGFIALVQLDMKKLVAYSSISHMGFVTLGLFMFTGMELNQTAVVGAIVQMVSHGFVSAAMFFSIGVLYDRMHTRNIADYGGVANKMPIFSSFFVLFAMANAALPATSGFVGELMVILGAIQVNFWYGVLAATTLVVGAAYTLWMVKRVIFGDVANEAVAQLKDVGKREIGILTVLALAILGMGLYPIAFTTPMHQSVNELIWHVAQSKLPT